MAEMTGPDGRYRVQVDLLASADGERYTRHSQTQGMPVWDLVGQGGMRQRQEATGAEAHGYLVLVEDLCSLLLVPGESGLTVREVKLLGAVQAVITAQVTPGEGAPEWLPAESCHLLFQGGRSEAAAYGERYIPLDGMAGAIARSDGGQTPLDSLALAVGRSVARANGRLARIRSEGGVALVASATLRFAVVETSLVQGRVLVRLAREGAEQGGQYLELNMATVPGGQSEEP